jgi:secondary thiamine-phosphate synthase enzyme
MRIVTDSIHVSTRGEDQMIDLTPKLEERLRAAGLSHGLATVFVSGSTAGVTTVEFEPGLQKDIPEALERIAPRAARYHHDETWHDGNGHSHVRASLVGPSLTIPFTGGRFRLGTWQQAVLIDFDNRPRERDIVVQFAGE